MWSLRPVIPLSLRSRVLQALLESHPGTSRMNSLARMNVRWHNCDRDIEKLSRGCHSCQSVKHLPPVAPLKPWIWTSRASARVHIDFAGTVFEKIFLQ